MKGNTRQSRPLFWFYILVGYILIQFIWWGYMMFNLNKEIVLLKNEINLLNGESPQEIITKGNELNQALHKRWLMISGEGVVFIGLLIVGFYQVRKTFKKEEELAQLQKNFLLSVTHELKSPIASAKLQLQTLLKHELEREKQKEIISNAIKDTDRLNNLVENILLAAKIENDVYLLNKETQDLSLYLTELIDNASHQFAHKQQIKFDIQPGIMLAIDKNSFPSLVFNLIENAIKYSTDDSTITVKLQQKNNNIIFSVIDEGIGISEIDKQNIFRKFYRVGSEETRKTKGTGLGLFIVDHLVKQHNGIVTVKDNQPKGSIFEVVFSG